MKKHIMYMAKFLGFIYNLELFRMWALGGVHYTTPNKNECPSGF